MTLSLIKPDWPAPANVNAWCSTRQGGVSQPPYHSLNLGIRTRDCAEDVVENRLRLRQQLSLLHEPDWLVQTHSTDVVVLEDTENREADAAITRSTEHVAAVLTADCLPILLTSVNGDEVAAAHAGWRGLQSGVIETTVQQMETEADQLLAWVGPGISQRHFEVGEEVLEAFLSRLPESERFFVPGREAHWYCDLPAIADLVLSSLGVSQVFRDPHCTYADEALFHSYRRDGESGRMASLIWLTP